MSSPGPQQCWTQVLLYPTQSSLPQPPLPCPDTFLFVSPHYHKTTLSVGPCLSILGRNTHRLTHTLKGKTLFHLKIPFAWLTTDLNEVWDLKTMNNIPSCQNYIAESRTRYGCKGLANFLMPMANDGTKNIAYGITYMKECSLLSRELVRYQCTLWNLCCQCETCDQNRQWKLNVL